MNGLFIQEALRYQRPGSFGAPPTLPIFGFPVPPTGFADIAPGTPLNASIDVLGMQEVRGVIQNLGPGAGAISVFYWVDAGAPRGALASIPIPAGTSITYSFVIQPTSMSIAFRDTSGLGQTIDISAPLIYSVV